jgi:hypothetical protein
MSQADAAAHAAASHVRLPKRAPGATLSPAEQIEAAYQELDLQDSAWAARIPEQVAYELAAGGEDL